MRLLAVADLHLGAGSAYGRQPHGPESRLADQEQVWLRVCDLAVSDDVDAVLFAGDVGHRRELTNEEELAFRAGLARLRKHGIPIFAIPGNHDTSSAYRPCTLDLFANELELYRTPATRDFRDVTLAFLPWTPPAQLVARLNGGGGRDSIHRNISDLLVEEAHRLRRECSPEHPAILIAHWSVTSAETPEGLLTDEFPEPVLPLAEIEAMGWDAVVLGHIHRAQLLGSEDAPGPIFYCGSPNVVRYGEEQADHGVWIIDTDAIAPSLCRFVRIADRSFVTVEWGTISSDADIESLFASIVPGVFEDAVVRVRYQATSDMARKVDQARLTRAYLDAGAALVYKIQPEIIRDDRARVAGVDETLSPRQALDLWTDHQEYDEPFATAVRQRGAGYFEEVPA